MPRKDGAGPLGIGPFIGRGLGQCRGVFSLANRLPKKKTGILSILVPLLGATIRDAFNPHGLLISGSRKWIKFKNIKSPNNASDGIYQIGTDNHAKENKSIQVKLADPSLLLLNNKNRSTGE